MANNFLNETGGSSLVKKIKNILKNNFISADKINGKEDVSNKVTTISSSSTNTEYPSAKAVYDLVDTNMSGKEEVSNKVTSISSSSTNSKYPSAKAVYDLVDGTLGDISAALAAIVSI